MAIDVKTPDSGREYQWIRQLWETEWGGQSMVSHGRCYALENLHQLLAYEHHTFLGAVTWAVHGDEAEVVSLNAIQENRGVGSALLRAVESQARLAHVPHLYLITTNDNLHALAFYQKRGYRLTAIYLGAVDEARHRKPSIPLVAANGIPIHDEIRLDKPLL